MKYILTILITAFTFVCYGQYPVKQTLGSPGTIVQSKGALASDSGFVNASYPDTIAASRSKIASYPGAQISVGNTIYLRDSTATKWINQTGASLRYGGAITSLPAIGFSPNTNSVPEWIDAVFYQSQPPTATLTGGQTLEYQSATTLNYTLTYTAGRQSATSPLLSIVVAGNNKSFSQPSQGGSVSGTQSVSFPANTDVTYYNVVTTTDNKTATATTTFSFLPKRYWGWITDVTGIGYPGFDDSKITSLSSELSASKSKSFSTGNPTGSQFFVYAYYSTAGDLTQWDMNGFPSLDAMNKVTRMFTNALGYSGTWTIYWSKNAQTLSSTIVAN